MEHSFQKNILPKSFYTQSVLTVAENLLGKIFVRKITNSIISAKIVEVEAYDGSIDEAAHTYRGKTQRNKLMFEEGGILYVYFIYGNHYCANVVTGNKNEGKAVLIRAAEPIEGIDRMAINRFGRKCLNRKEYINLTNGPGKFCKSFGINKSHGGVDLLSENIFILNNDKLPKDKIIKTTRIGITRSKEFNWRFCIKDNPFVSKP
ncbi:MAG: DNA-3-methyladenine glycosylase [Melioribacteraceae bacterium]|nr:DNA-3-methyladenine glycosylase [Melioribacteraceae bacterium]